jgi:predicted transcriptional regulator of viral defense system
MNIRDFEHYFELFPAISTSEINKAFPDFSKRNLSNWLQKGYIVKLRNGWYGLAPTDLSNATRFAIANVLYTPSYISLESALSWHNMIPEGVFTTTSVCSRKTYIFENAWGTFSYSNLAPHLHLGYTLVRIAEHQFKIATPEKAILDFLHLRPSYNTIEGLEGLRLNEEIIRNLNQTSLEEYLLLFENKQLEKRLDLLLNIYR